MAFAKFTGLVGFASFAKFAIPAAQADFVSQSEFISAAEFSLKFCGAVGAGRKRRGNFTGAMIHF